MIILRTIALWVAAIALIIILASAVYGNWVFNVWYKALCKDEDGEV